MFKEGDEVVCSLYEGDFKGVVIKYLEGHIYGPVYEVKLHYIKPGMFEPNSPMARNGIIEIGQEDLRI